MSDSNSSLFSFADSDLDPVDWSLDDITNLNLDCETAANASNDDQFNMLCDMEAELGLNTVTPTIAAEDADDEAEFDFLSQMEAESLP